MVELHGLFAADYVLTAGSLDMYILFNLRYLSAFDYHFSRSIDTPQLDPPFCRLDLPFPLCFHRWA